MSGEMKVERKTADSKPIKAHSSAIQMTHKLSLVQHKAWLILLRNAYHELPQAGLKKHKMRLSELVTYLGYTGNRNDKYLKDLLEDLVDTKVSWNIFDKDGETEWGVASLLAGCKVKKGVVEYDYSSFLREKLYNPKMFAMLNLKILNQFKSKYSLALYNLCKDYLNIGQTPHVELEKFREFVGLEEHEYADFKSLNRRVIKEPIKEINELSDVLIRAEYTKEKRMVVGLKFYIAENPQMKLDFKSLTDQAITEKFVSGEGEPKDKTYNRMISFGLSDKQARHFISVHGEDYISENLDIVEKECRAGNVKNVSAYAVTALKDDFRPRQNFLEKEQETRKKAARAKQISDTKRSYIKKLHDDFEIKRLDDAINALSGDERKRLEREFLDENRSNVFLMQYHRQHGFDNFVVKGAFFSFAKERLATVPATAYQFRSYLRKEDHDPDAYEEEIDEMFGMRG